MLTGGSAPPYAGGLNAAPCPLQAHAQYAGSACQQQGRKLTFPHSSCADFYTSEVAPTGKLRMQSTIEGCVGLESLKQDGWSISQTRWLFQQVVDTLCCQQRTRSDTAASTLLHVSCLRSCGLPISTSCLEHRVQYLQIVFFVCSMSTTCPSNIF